MIPLSTRLSEVWHNYVKPLAVAFLVVLCLIFVLFSLAANTGCATKPPALSGTNTVIAVVSNLLPVITSVEPFVPAQWASTGETILAVITAALGAWNLHQQQSIKQLKLNGATADRAMATYRADNPPARHPPS